jgi:hypothetical protein
MPSGSYPKNWATAANLLANHEKYGTILKEYNELFARQGHVNNKKFYLDVIKPVIPQYGLGSWYNFLKRFSCAAGLQVAYTRRLPRVPTEEEKKLEVGFMETQTQMLSNQEATQRGIQAALNIGAARLQYLSEHPELITPKEASELLFKAMKSQDSRIHAIGKVREDTREQEKFDRAFGESSLSEEDN